MEDKKEKQEKYIKIPSNALYVKIEDSTKELIPLSKKENIIEDVFFIYNDGRLVSHFTTRLKPIDSEILGSMFTAVQNFIKESIGYYEEKSKLSQLVQGKYTILIEHGYNFFLAVSTTNPTDTIQKQLKLACKDISNEYSQVLKDWDGDKAKLIGTEKYIKKLLYLDYGDKTIEEEPIKEKFVKIPTDLPSSKKQENIKLNHFIWYPIPGKGYQDKPIAFSKDFNPILYTSMFKNEFIPIIVSYSKEDFRGYLFFNNPQKNQILFSWIYPKKRVDEYGRTGVFHHSVIIDRTFLQNGEISLFSVKKAMEEFSNENEFPKDEIPQLLVQKNENRSFNYLNNLKKYVSKASIETLATRIMSNSKNKTIFRCLSASQEDRLKIAIYLIELLNFNCKIRPISFSTEVPISNEYYQLFDILVLERAYPPSADAEDWAVILWDLEEPQLKRIENKDDVYKKIEDAFF